MFDMLPFVRVKSPDSAVLVAALVRQGTKQKQRVELWMRYLSGYV